MPSLGCGASQSPRRIVGEARSSPPWFEPFGLAGETSDIVEHGLREQRSGSVTMRSRQIASLTGDLRHDQSSLNVVPVLGLWRHLR
jgi:hypothetical protein